MSRASHRKLLQGTTQDFDLLLAIGPSSSKAYGGRHITIASMTAPDRPTALKAVRDSGCSSKLTDYQGTYGWYMNGPPSNCLGHMDASETTCHDSKPWNLQR